VHDSAASDCSPQIVAPKHSGAATPIPIGFAAQNLIREPLERFVPALELAPQVPDSQARAAYFVLEQGRLDDAFDLYLAAADQGSAGRLAGYSSTRFRSAQRPPCA
jgi:hypothetical protein